MGRLAAGVRLVTPTPRVDEGWEEGGDGALGGSGVRLVALTRGLGGYDREEGIEVAPGSLKVRLDDINFEI